MAWINYDDIHSGKYAQLSQSARILIPVLTTVCHKHTGEIPNKYSSAAALGELAGLSEKHVRLGLDELAEAKTVSINRKNGRIPSIQYCPEVHSAKNAPPSQSGSQSKKTPPEDFFPPPCSCDAIAKAQTPDPTEVDLYVWEQYMENECQNAQLPVEPSPEPTDPAAIEESDPILTTGHLGENDRGYIDESPEPEIHQDAPDSSAASLRRDSQSTKDADPTTSVNFTEVPPPNLGEFHRGDIPEDLPEMPVDTEVTKDSAPPPLFKQQYLKTTTTDLPVSKMLIKDMIKTYGVRVVVDVISGMEKLLKLDPNHFYNPAAYFRMCCSRGWTPTSKTIQEREKSAERRRREQERQEKERIFQEAAKRNIEAEQNDPETQARIAAIQAEFWKNLDAPQDGASNAASGHARSASSFA